MAHRAGQAYTVADRFEAQVERYGPRDFFVFADRRYSYEKFNQEINQLAHFLRERGVRKGDVIGLIMSNRPEYCQAWLALAKLGATAALINPNTRSDSLRHALSTVDCSALLCGEEILSVLTELGEPLECSVWVVANPSPTLATDMGISHLRYVPADFSTENPDPEFRIELTADDPLFYIFTSGTTGLPKAVYNSHLRWLRAGDCWHSLLSFSPDDVFYCALPLYHGAATLMVASMTIASGASLVLRDRFSASAFWDDVRKHGVTTFQYIGEICRYLLNQPPRPDDAEHSLRRIIGAGLTAPVWRAFQERFGAVEVYESWGSTESNCSMNNFDGKIGACGRIPFKEKSNLRLARYSVAEGCHDRDGDGYLIECAPGEVGEALGQIFDDPVNAFGHFEGYSDSAATEAKILHGVFEPDDRWYHSGDLLYRDEDDYYYFVDRIGDTFRWKSENVSTMEVEQALTGFSGLQFSNVYGVKVPGEEGRAGMAALVLESASGFDGYAFYQWVSQRLPSYASPLFLRLGSEASLTDSFKLRKVDLQREGYDVDLVSDPLFVRDDGEKCYVPVTGDVLRRLRIPSSKVGDDLAR